MNVRYLEVAQQVCDAEKCRDWLLASNLWHQAMQYARGANLFWAITRFESCCIRNGVRPNNFVPRDGV